MNELQMLKKLMAMAHAVDGAAKKGSKGAVQATAAADAPKRRGRPPKVRVEAVAVKRRGRPPMTPEQRAARDAAKAAEKAAQPPKRRGRPPKALAHTAPGGLVRVAGDNRGTETVAVHRTSYANESELLKQVAHYLDVKAAQYGFAWFHPMQEGRRSYAMAAWAKARGMKAGVPDIMAFGLPGLPGGKNVAIELKTDKGALSEQQSLWLSMLAHAGFVCAVCRSLEDVAAVVEPLLDPRATAFAAAAEDEAEATEKHEGDDTTGGDNGGLLPSFACALEEPRQAAAAN